jgi:hypothetical protein
MYVHRSARTPPSSTVSTGCATTARAARWCAPSAAPTCSCRWAGRGGAGRGRRLAFAVGPCRRTHAGRLFLPVYGQTCGEGRTRAAPASLPSGPPARRPASTPHGVAAAPFPRQTIDRASNLPAFLPDVKVKVGVALFPTASSGPGSCGYGCCGRGQLGAPCSCGLLPSARGALSLRSGAARL